MEKRLISNHERRLFVELLPTWQPVAALAYRCKIPVRTALMVLLDMESRGIVKKVRARLDGHNRVHCFKKLEYVRVLGVDMPVNTVEEA